MADVGKFQQQGRMYKAFESLYKFLVNNICNNLVNVASLFQGFINLLEESGVPEEKCIEYRTQCYADDEIKFRALYDNITSHELKWIHDRVEDLRAQMRVSGDGMDPGPLNVQPPNQISSITPKQFNIRTGNEQQYITQLHALCDFMNFLVEQRDSINNILKFYSQILNDMLQEGVPKEVMYVYWQNFGQPNGNLVKNIQHHIETTDYDSLRKLFIQVNQSLSKLNIPFDRTPKTM